MPHQRNNLILVTFLFRLLARLFLSLRVPQSTLFAEFTASGSQEEVDILFASENAMVFFRTWSFRLLFASVLKFLSQRYNVELLDLLHDSLKTLLLEARENSSRCSLCKSRTREYL